MVVARDQYADSLRLVAVGETELDVEPLAELVSECMFDRFLVVRVTELVFETHEEGAPVGVGGVLGCIDDVCPVPVETRRDGGDDAALVGAGDKQTVVGHRQCDTAAAASSEMRVSVWKRSSASAEMSSGVRPVATSSASVVPTIGAALKPYVPHPAETWKFSSSVLPRIGL